MKIQVLCILGLICSQQTFAQTPLFDDQFSAKDDSKWTYLMVGTGNFAIDNKIDLALAANTSSNAYSDSAIVSKNEISMKNLSINILRSPKEKGSRGWGYWNGEMDPSKSAIAWFIYLEGDASYPLNGFYAMIQAPGSAPAFIPLDPTLMNSAHVYSIAWSNSLKFSVDGVVVASSVQNVLAAMEIHIWQDNAVYDPNTFGPLLQNVSTSAPLSIGRVQVTDY